MRAIDRLYAYFKDKEIKPSVFEKTIGVSNGYFSKQLEHGSSMGSNIIEKIAYQCTDLDILWLLTGEGEMIKSDHYLRFNTGEPVKAYGKSAIPLITIDKFTPPFSNFRLDTQCEYIYIPGFEDCDIAMQVWGQGLESAYKHGDVVILKELDQINNIVFGDVYLIYTKDLTLIRRILKSEKAGNILLHIDDLTVAPLEIALKNIRHAYRLKGCIKRFTI